MSEDIGPAMEGWEYRPGKITARKIKGRNGKDKIQMRIELGLLQMEAEGRPDGKRPYRKESLLDYYLLQLEQYKASHGTTRGFELSKSDCESLYEEAVQYYHRYLSLFSLKDYRGVIRDTERNLRAHQLVLRYGADEQYKTTFARYIPYIIMMNTKAKALISLEKKDYQRALKQTKLGMERIDDFFQSLDQPELSKESEEIESLRELAREIRKKKPLTHSEKLNIELEEAVRREDFEEAARLRDKIKELQGKPR